MGAIELMLLIGVAWTALLVLFMAAAVIAKQADRTNDELTHAASLAPADLRVPERQPARSRARKVAQPIGV